MANVYGSITKATQKNVEGGYKNVVLFAPVDTFATFAAPTASPTAAGDKVTLVGNHTFTGAVGANGFISWLCKKHSVTTTAETVGDAGSQSLLHKASFTLLGDRASTLEQLQDLLNDDVVLLLKDQDCENSTEYVQLGSSCLAGDIKVSFDGKTTNEGLKEYNVEVSVKAKKYFYSGTITYKA